MPAWPSTPQPVVQHMQQAAEMRIISHSQHTVASTQSGAQSVPSPPGKHNAEDTWSCPNETGPSLAPLFSYISQGMDTLLTTMQRSQTAAHDVVMKEITAIRWELPNIPKATPRSSNPQHEDDTEIISGIQLPSKRARKSRNPTYFIPSNPNAPPVPKDFQEHKDFLVRTNTLVSCSTVLIQMSFAITGCYPHSRSLSLRHP